MPNVGFREIAGHLQGRITSGELPAGAPMPSESALAAEYGVSRTTARRALIVLERTGLIQGTAGRVRFVRREGAERPALARYEQVAAALHAEIEDGTLRPGQQIGTEDALAERFDVSSGTARRALQELASSGTVVGVSGRGWFVVSDDGPPTRTAETASAIRSAIVAGEWPVGTNIPGEKILAARYSVGRVTLRHALAILEAEGLLERNAAGGRVVLGR